MALAHRPRGRTPSFLVLVLLALVAAPALVAGCSGSSDDDALEAADLVAIARDADPELTEEQARCLVERTSERLGMGRSEELAREGYAGSGLSDEVDTIRDACLSTGSGAGATTPPTVPGQDQYPAIGPDAQGYGDDPTLDRLWDECEAGSGRACDDLYYLAPLDSEYEAFGYSCGNRENIILCSELDR